MNDDLEYLAGDVPGPRTAALAATLRAYEWQNVTYLADDFPVFWDSGSGATVTDVDHNRYLDLTAAFGVANIGHANPAVASAVAAQAHKLMHGMGDVHPTAVRTLLLERLAQILPIGLSKTFLTSTGSEAVEAALKTAMLATGKPRFACYRGAYHGLSLGALGVCGIEKFREPFAAALGHRPLLLDYPRDGSEGAEEAAASVRDALGACGDVAALIVEPIQGRGGCVVPPPGYLAALRGVCDDAGVVMIVDEIYTGFGRTGAWFAIEHDRVVPDIVCIGKAMGSGFPIGAAVGRAAIVDAWPVSHGEALHTSTYLGNPMGCAAALTTIDELERLRLPERAAGLGCALGARLQRLRSHAAVVDVRGRGLLWGVQLRDGTAAETVVKRALARGAIVLQSGIAGDAISISPPLIITERQLDRAIDLLEAAIESVP